MEANGKTRMLNPRDYVKLAKDEGAGGVSEEALLAVIIEIFFEVSEPGRGGTSSKLRDVFFRTVGAIISVISLEVGVHPSQLASSAGGWHP